MRTDTHKEWTDAFRESFPEEVRPSEGGWEAVAGRLRRAAARRKAAIAAAALALPLAGGVFFLNHHDSGESRIEVRETPGLVAQVTEQSDGQANDTLVLSGTGSEHNGTANEHPVLRNATSEQASTANEPSVLRDTESEHADMTNESPALRNATSEHASTANEPTVLSDAESEHGDTANEPPVLREADPEHISADFSDVEEAMPVRRAHRLTAGISAASMADGAPTTVTVSSLAGGLVTKSSNVASNSFLNNSKGMIMQKEYVHDLPLSFGLNARYWLSDRLSVESGLEYSYLHSRLDDIHTVMHFAGIPLRVDYSLFNAGPVEFYTGIGGKVEKCLKASLGGMRVKERDLQWSGTFNVGARSRLSKNAWIYFQPDFSYYFTRTNLTSYRTENRLGLSLRAGILFDINH